MSDTKLKLFITALHENPTLSLGKDLLQRHTPTNFVIAEKKEDAEIILYLDNDYIGLAELPDLFHEVQSVPSAKHFLFSECDWPFPILPGAYPSLYKPCPWAHSWCYLPKPNFDNANSYRLQNEPQLLFSFLGRVWTHSVRQRILLLDKANSPCMDVADGSKRISGYEYSNSYWTLIADSKFVLCPRGFGASSFRIFEAMSLGRVPVIVSDEWQRPPGISWDECCVVVPEKDVSHIPAILREWESKFEMMSKLARQAYDSHFAPSVFFDRLLMTMMSNYSKCDFSIGSNFSRAWRAIGTREIRTLGSQAKTRFSDLFFKGAAP